MILENVQSQGNRFLEVSMTRGTKIYLCPLLWVHYNNKADRDGGNKNEVCYMENSLRLSGVRRVVCPEYMRIYADNCKNAGNL